MNVSKRNEQGTWSECQFKNHLLFIDWGKFNTYGYKVAWKLHYCVLFYTTILQRSMTIHLKGTKILKLIAKFRKRLPVLKLNILWKVGAINLCKRFKYKGEISRFIITCLFLLRSP